jgi:selenide, water dikinase
MPTPMPPTAPTAPTAPARPRELVLLGGGHAHVEVLRRLPSFDPRVRVTLVARELLAPYSGMLPGCVAGKYRAREGQIDLRALAARAGARGARGEAGAGAPGAVVVLRGEAAAIDVPGRRVLVRRVGESGGDGARDDQQLQQRQQQQQREDDRQQEECWLPFDLLSVNVGAQPSARQGAPGADQHATPVKPIDSFLERWEGRVLPLARRALGHRARELLKEQRGRPLAEESGDNGDCDGDGDGGGDGDGEQDGRPPFRVAVVGGGAGGVELAFAAAQRLKSEWEQAWRREEEEAAAAAATATTAAARPPPPPPPVGVALYSRGRILRGAPASARALFLRMAAESRGLVSIEEGAGVAAVEAGALVLDEEGAAAAEAQGEADAGAGAATTTTAATPAAQRRPHRARRVPFDACLWCTQASAPAWFAGAQSRGLPLDAGGFLRTRPTLQLSVVPPAPSSASAPASAPPSAPALAPPSPPLLLAEDCVFAAGDAAAIDGYLRPKAGVFAVRAGPFLAENLRRQAAFLADAAERQEASGEGAQTTKPTPPPLPPPPLLSFFPQQNALALISAGTGTAVAVRPPFPLCASGAWVWRWKDRIDRAFVRRYGAGLEEEEEATD